MKNLRNDDPVWLRGAKGEDPFVPAKVTDVQQAGGRITVVRGNGSTEVLDRSKADI